MQLSQCLKNGGLLYINGTLGAGKTTLCKGILAGLGHEGTVKSPTYTIVEIYQLSDLTVYHFDLYRLSDPEELEYLGGREYFDNPQQQNALCMVEWTKKAEHWLPKPNWTVTLEPHNGARIGLLIPEANT